MLQKLQETILQSSLIYPEIFLAILAIILVILATFSVSYRSCLVVFMFGMLLTGLAMWSIIFFLRQDSTVPTAYLQISAGLLTQSYQNIVFKTFFIFAGIFTAFLSYQEQNLKKDGVFLALLTSIILAMNLACSTNNLLLLYICIEVVSVLSYLLLLFQHTYLAKEAAVKYFLTGATVSGIMLYGISLLYGFSGSLSIPDIASKVIYFANLPFYFACLLTLLGFLFKIVAVPVHTWVADVYEGTATSIVAFLTTASKILGIAILFFVLQTAAYHKISIQNFISILAILSLLFGTFGAILQQNAKRLLAYSSVAHSGFLLALLSSVSYFNDTLVDNFYTLIFYLLSYFLLSYAVFYSILLVENSRKSSNIEAFAGLGKIQTDFAILILFIFMGFAALPPTSGFTAKLLVFMALLQTYSTTPQTLSLILLLVLLLTSLVSLYFYLKIPYYLFFKKIEHKAIAIRFIDKFLLFILALAILVLFIKPEIM